MTQPPPDTTKLYHSLTIDWEAYGEMLEDSDLSDEQTIEMIATLWSIVVSCVDLGFDVGQPCAQNTESRIFLDHDLLSSLQGNPTTKIRDAGKAVAKEET